MNTRRPAILALAALALAAAVPQAARAQLTEPEVLLVYDSRIDDSRDIAEYYVGSARFGGSAGYPGVHPRVNLLDISSRPSTVAVVPPAVPPPAGVFPATFDTRYGLTYTEFKTQLRDPLRAYLWSSGLARRIRCILLTTGIPHRIRDMGTYPQIGDDPASAGNNPFNLTYASVDAELCLLFQSLDAGEAGVAADSRADGGLKNPLWRQTLPVRAWSRRYLAETKSFTAPGGGWAGVYWLNGADPNIAATLTPGDMYLVCRLDGNTPADVKAMIDRAQNLYVPTADARFVLDTDTHAFDNQGPADVNGGADYAQAAAELAPPNPLAATNTTRFVASNVVFNSAGAATMPAQAFMQFVVGSRIDYSAFGSPIVLGTEISPARVLLLATPGANHAGVGVGSTPGTTYASSFHYLPGATFNSLESFNGRNLGGLTGGIPQEQAADALAAGATFAVANVWEPFSIFAADNLPIVRNFYLGDLTWAEAAYTSLPVLSWQQVVLGDPLARVRRDRDDVNHDTHVNIDDLYAQHTASTDVNRSGGADTTDVRLIEQTARQYEHAAMKGAQR